MSETLIKRAWAGSNKMECGDASEIWCGHDPELLEELATELARLATLETAVLTIIKAMQSYLPPDSGVTEKDFISEVIGAVDNPAVFAALHGTSDAGNDSLKRALERDK